MASARVMWRFRLGVLIGGVGGVGAVVVGRLCDRLVGA
jgi:hypothetical protein